MSDSGCSHDPDDNTSPSSALAGIAITMYTTNANSVSIPHTHDNWWDATLPR